MRSPNYEKEWRIISNKGLETYSPDNLDSIIFGMNMTIEERNTLRHILSNRKVNFFEAIKSKRRFALEIIPVSFAPNRLIDKIEELY